MNTVIFARDYNRGWSCSLWILFNIFLLQVPRLKKSQCLVSLLCKDMQSVYQKYEACNSVEFI